MIPYSHFCYQRFQVLRLKPVVKLLVIGIAFLFYACATQPQRSAPDAERIRQNAGQAHADLKAAEGYPDLSNSKAPTVSDRTGISNAQPPVSETPVESGRRPDWIDNPGGRYSQNNYMTGVGYGQERRSAEDHARSEIAKIFQSDIASENRSYEEYLQTSEGGRTRSAQNFNFEDITTVSTRKVLSDIRIAAVYLEKKPQTGYYALAVLDRNHVRPILTEKIAILDREIDQMLDVAENDTDHLTKIRAYKSGIEKYVLRQAFNTELRIVRTDGRGIPPRFTLADIQQKFARVLLKDFAVMVTVKGDRAAEVQQALTEALNQKGFSVSFNSAKADVFARGNVQIRPMDQGSAQWKFVRWKAYFDLVDRQGGVVFGSVQKSGKEGHVTISEAEERAVRKIRKVLAADISKDLSAYIFSTQN